MSDQRFMSVRAYAKAREVTHSTVLHHVKRGVIQLTKDGLVDRIQADRARAAVRRSPYLGRGDPNGQSAQARIRKITAKLEMARDAVARLHDQYAPRSDANEEYKREAKVVIDALKAMPEQEAATVAV